MRQTRTIVFFIVVSLAVPLLVLTTAAQQPKAPVAEREMQRPQFTLRLGVTPEILQGIQTGWRDSKALPDSGGFRCDDVKTVTLTVKKNDKNVVVDPPKVRVKIGECIEWTLSDPSGNIELIDLIDTAAEADPKHPVSEHPAGDECFNAGPRCLVLIAWQKGKYRYKAKVFHDGTKKENDPEIEVLSTPMGGN